MIAWLAPAAMFWTVTALYLGGFPLRIEGGGGLRHIIGLLATFVLFMLVFAGVHMVLLGMAGPILSVALSCVVCTLLLPILSRVGFMLLGVKIRTMPAHY